MPEKLRVAGLTTRGGVAQCRVTDGEEGWATGIDQVLADEIPEMSWMPKSARVLGGVASNGRGGGGVPVEVTKGHRGGCP